MNNSIDFGTDDPKKLFFKICIPTTIAMVISALYVIADGIFIGQSIGEHGLAAVNIIVPIFTILTGLAMLFGYGGSTLCAIELSKRNKEKCNSIFSQVFFFLITFMIVFTIVVFSFSEKICLLLGSNEVILGYSNTYLKTMIVFSLFFVLNMMLSFYVRLDGAPKVAMISTVIGGLTNIILDYIFIFPLHMGLFGAALATGIGNIIPTALMLFYLLKKSKNIKIKFQRIKIKTINSASKIGFPSLLTELCITIVTIGYNIILMNKYAEVGVSAYSIINYIHPFMLLIFMGISQSLQPIVSYNYGIKAYERINQSIKIAFKTALCFGVVAVLIGLICNKLIVSAFLDSSYESFEMAIKGLPLFFVNYIFLGINMVAVAYFQSISKPNLATIITLLRGVIFVMILLFTLPNILGINGIWLSVPLSETIGSFVVVFLMKRASLQNQDISKDKKELATLIYS